MTTVADPPFTPLGVAVERLNLAVSPLVGIVTRTVSTTHTTDECSLPNCAAELASSRRTLGAVTVEYGSGADPVPARARAAALGEAIERYAAMFVPNEVFRIATARELARAVDPARFALFHARQHDEPGFPFVPFTADTKTHWVEATAVGDDASAWLPAQLVYLGRPTPMLAPIAYSTSSGLACGPTLAEAILAGLLELVERDAVMLAWKCRLSLPLLDWLADDASRTLDDRFFSPSGLRFAVVDASCFLRVPVAIAVVHGPERSRAALAVGAGAAADVRGAWLKAVAEAFGVYRWLGRQAASHGDRPLPDPSEIETFDDHMLYYSRREQAELAAFLDASPHRTSTAAVDPLEGRTPRAQLASLVSRLADHGLTAYATDVTSPDVRSLGLRVARVVCPELCALDVSHRGRFLGGRRLYTAAHDAGLVSRPLDIDELNPLPHPFP